MKHKMNLMGLVLALGGMLLSGCGSSTKPSTSNSTETPSTSTSTGGEETSSTFTREDAKRIFQEALDADYSNMIVAISMSYDLENGVQNEYIEEIVYNGYTIIPALYDGDATLYYHDYEGESYLYFPDNYGHGDAWLNKGKDDAALGLENTYFSWDYSLPYIDIERVAYSSGYYIIADSELIETLNNTMFRFAWFNDIEYVTMLVSDGHITDIVGLCSLENDEEFVRIQMRYFGNAAYTDNLPTAPNKDNIKTYYEYTGTEPFVDKYVSSLTVEVKDEVKSDDTYGVILDLDETATVAASYLPEDANKVEITWHSSDESIVKIDYHQTTLHRILRAMKEGEVEIYATAVGENNTTVTSNKIKVKVNSLKQQNKNGAVYDFDFVNIANDNVIAINNVTTNATSEIVSNRATLRDSSEASANRFETGRQLLCLDPLKTDFSKPSGAYITFDFDDQQVFSLSFYYGMIYENHRNYLKQVNKAVVLTSNDGETWAEYDFLEEMQNNISSTNLKLLEVSFAPASQVKILLSASMVGNQFLFAMDHVLFLTDENCHQHQDPSTNVDVTGIEITATKTLLKEEETATFVSSITPSDATNKTLTWHSTNEEVLSISDTGVATALTAGTAEVYATSVNNVESNHVTITIKEKDHLPDTQVNKSYAAIDIYTNSNYYDFKLNLTDLYYATLEVMASGAEKVTYNFTLDHYDDDSRFYYFTNENSLTMKVKFNDSTSNAEVFAELENKLSLGNKYTNSGEEFALYVASTGITTSFDEKTMTVGSKVTLIADVEPANATYKDVTYTNTHPEVADFEETDMDEDNSTTLVAKSVGSTTITFVNHEGFSKSVTIMVTEPVKVSEIVLDKTEIASLEVGKSETVTATINPSDAANKNVTWSTSNDKVAMVNKNGKITGIGEGDAIITCTANDNSGVKAIVTVHVVASTGSVSLPEGISGDYEGGFYYGTYQTIATVDEKAGSIRLVCEDAEYDETFTLTHIDADGNYVFKGTGDNQILVFISGNTSFLVVGGEIAELEYDGTEGDISFFLS